MAIFFFFFSKVTLKRGQIKSTFYSTVLLRKATAGLGVRQRVSAVLMHRLVKEVCGIVNISPSGASPAPLCLPMHVRQHHVPGN